MMMKPMGDPTGGQRPLPFNTTSVFLVPFFFTRYQTSLVCLPIILNVFLIFFAISWQPRSCPFNLSTISLSDDMSCPSPLCSSAFCHNIFHSGLLSDPQVCLPVFQTYPEHLSFHSSLCSSQLGSLGFCQGPCLSGVGHCRDEALIESLSF